jgi:hypothetical protein
MIFKDMVQRLRFAFSLQQFPGETGTSAMVAVRTALSQAGVKKYGAMTKEAVEELRGAAKAVIGETLALPPFERDALLAAHSRSWESKRLATDNLRHHFMPLLAGLLDDKELAGKLVTRHYIANRDRGSGWGKADLAEHYRIGMERLERAIALVDRHAKELEHAALQTLEAKIAEIEHA